MKKSMLAISACLALGITACSDRETAPPPAGDMAGGTAVAPTGEMPSANMADSAESSADSGIGASNPSSEAGAISESRRTTIHRSRSMVKSDRSNRSARNRDTYAANRNDAYTESGEHEADASAMNTGATSASQEAGYSSQSEQPMVGRHNPAAINSGF